MNPCINSITFVSKDLQAITDLHNKVLACHDNKADSSVSSFIKSYGYPVLLGKFRPDNRDVITECEKSISRRKGKYSFIIETVSAWMPNLEPFEALLKDKYHSKISMYHCSEEEGCGIYEVYDPTGTWYPDRFKVDWGIQDEFDTDYFPTFREMLSYLKKTFPKADLCELDTLPELEGKIADAYDDPNINEFFISINRFSEYQPMMFKEVPYAEAV